MTSLLSLLVVGLVGAGAGAPRAAAVCEEESPPELSEATTPIPMPGPALVPCAMVESGVLGPACQDVAFYVVTDGGVLLCSVDLDTFSLTQAPVESVERAPAVPGASPSGTSAFVALAAEGFKLSPRCAVQLQDAGATLFVAPADRPDHPPVPPS